MIVSTVRWTNLPTGAADICLLVMVQESVCEAQQLRIIYFGDELRHQIRETRAAHKPLEHCKHFAVMKGLVPKLMKHLCHKIVLVEGHNTAVGDRMLRTQGRGSGGLSAEEGSGDTPVTPKKIAEKNGRQQLFAWQQKEGGGKNPRIPICGLGAWIPVQGVAEGVPTSIAKKEKLSTGPGMGRS